MPDIPYGPYPAFRAYVAEQTTIMSSPSPNTVLKTPSFAEQPTVTSSPYPNMVLKIPSFASPATKQLSDYTLSDFNEDPWMLLEKETYWILDRVDVSETHYPNWNKQNLNYTVFGPTLGYKRFVAVVDHMNKLPVDRLHMEAAWIKFLMRKYELFDPRDTGQRRVKWLRNETFESLMRHKKVTLYAGFNSVSSHAYVAFRLPLADCRCYR
jgi:hypothetical protein